MAQINETITEKLEKYPEVTRDICREIVAFAQNMPLVAVKEHLDNLVRKAVKKGDAKL